MADRILSLETEFGCLIDDIDADISPEQIASRVRDHIFSVLELGVLDVYYRDWGEPPGNGGFLFNGGRLYIDMGHLEYAAPECLTVLDALIYDRTIEPILLRTLDDLGLRPFVSFIKNNIDHQTGATFGCHENYLVRRYVPFHQVLIPALMAFFVTRQIFAGAGRVGANDIFFEGDDPERFIGFQISQRADYIVTDVYEWVQFSRAIINARDEPLADYRKYRRLHLLVGDSNMCELANTLKLGTTRLLLDVLEEDPSVNLPVIVDPVEAIRDISRDPDFEWLVMLENSDIVSAIDVQRMYWEQAHSYLAGRDNETDWILTEWKEVLDALEDDREQLIGRVDWVTKRWLLETFREEEGLEWDDPWLESLDLEYHNLDPEKGLYFELERAGTIQRLCADEQIQRAMDWAPGNTRAKARSRLMRALARQRIPCAVDWDFVYFIQDKPFEMPNPFETYDRQVKHLLALIKQLKRQRRENL